MKIRDKSLIEGNEQLGQLRNQQRRTLTAKENNSNSAGVDKIDISRAREINSQLDPQSIALERKARVEELKQLVQSGKYSPPTRDVATAFVAQIHEAVTLFSDGSSGNSGSGDNEEDDSLKF